MKVNRAKLAKVLGLVSSGVAKKETIEQTMSFVFRDKTVFSFNDEIAVSAPTDLDIVGAVPAKEFEALVNKIKSDELDITITDGEIRAKGSRAKAGIRLTPKIVLPIDDMKIPKKWKDLPANFVEAIRECLPAVSKDQTKPLLQCINFSGENVEATDNYRATRFTTESSAFDTPFLLPAKNAKELIALAPNKYNVSSGWVHFQNNDSVVVSCRCFFDTFPDISTIMINKGTDISFPKNLSDILDKASTIVDGVRVTISLADDIVTVSASNSMTWFEEPARVKYKGKPVAFEIVPEYLSQMLKKDVSILFTGKTIEFSTDDSVHVVFVLPSKK